MKIAGDIYLIGSGQFGISSALDCHIYLLKEGNEYLILDAGAGKFDSDSDTILNNIEQEGISLKSKFSLFLTHAHSDHSGGSKALRKKLDCKIYTNAITAGFVSRGDESELGLDFAKRSGFYGDDYKFKTFTVDNILQDGSAINIGNMEINCILTPGHSPDSMCFLIEKSGKKLLFTGDVLNHGGKIILLNCSGFDLKDYRENIIKLKDMAADMLFPGHGVFTLSGAQSHVENLINAFDKLLINSSLIL
jgi:glyoxylase-like metal-dependent hydrolase (beta-lactamase superfamily II)